MSGDVRGIIYYQDETTFLDGSLLDILRGYPDACDGCPFRGCDDCRYQGGEGPTDG